jgi:hypothetical protein
MKLAKSNLSWAETSSRVVEDSTMLPRTEGLNPSQERERVAKNISSKSFWGLYYKAFYSTNCSSIVIS